jgi:thiosulfate/3-mercaptopyruvate sulfurtransferase
VYKVFGVNNSDLLITAERLLADIKVPKLRILDCRFVLSEPEAGREAYLAGHIPGSVYADLDKDLAAPVSPGSGRHPLPVPAAFAQMLGRLGISDESRVVVYDDGSGGLAGRAWWMLRWMGHEQVSLLEGGFCRWRELSLPVDTGDVSVVQEQFSGSVRNELVVETDEILAYLDGVEVPALVDARDENRFAGKAEPIDKVAGHVPGAVNLPFQLSLNSDGTWKPAAELRKLWVQVLGGTSAERINVMCGSGVTACHLIISARLAGLPEPRLYVGSWSEWIEDPNRPIAVGETEKG